MVGFILDCCEFNHHLLFRMSFCETKWLIIATFVSSIGFHQCLSQPNKRTREIMMWWEDYEATNTQTTVSGLVLTPGMIITFPIVLVFCLYPGPLWLLVVSPHHWKVFVIVWMTKVTRGGGPGLGISARILGNWIKIVAGCVQMRWSQHSPPDTHKSIVSFVMLSGLIIFMIIMVQLYFSIYSYLLSK